MALRHGRGAVLEGNEDGVTHRGDLINDIENGLGMAGYPGGIVEGEKKRYNDRYSDEQEDVTPIDLG
jgi:hypothetical protein